MGQRWNDLLFAHWPVPASDIARLLPPGIEVDTFDGFAWIGVVPFWMDQVRTRAVGEHTFTLPSTETFCELNLRTYVRSPTSDLRGVYFFSLDATSTLAVAGARAFFHLPYFLADMHQATGADGVIEYDSKRLLTGSKARFQASYRGLGRLDGPSQPGSLEYFLTERYCLFTSHRRHVLVGHIHHLPWPLEAAEANISINQLPAAHGIALPHRPPVLHFARRLDVYIWSLCKDQ